MDFQSSPITSLRLYQFYMNLFPSQRQLMHVPGAFFHKTYGEKF